MSKAENKPNNNGDKNEHLVIFVNRKQKTQADGVTNPMTVNAIAGLVGLTSDNATVQEEQGESGKAGDPLSGSVEIKNGMHFLVTRKTVTGGNE